MVKSISLTIVIVLMSFYSGAQVGRINFVHKDDNTGHQYVNIYKQKDKLLFCKISPDVSHWIDTVVNNDTVRIPKVAINEHCGRYYGPYLLYKLKDSIFVRYYDSTFKVMANRKIYSLSRNDTVFTKELFSPVESYNANTTYVKDTIFTLKKSGKKRDCYLFNRISFATKAKEFIGIILIDKKSLIPVLEIYLDRKKNEFYRREAEFLNL